VHSVCGSILRIHRTLTTVSGPVYIMSSASPFPPMDQFPPGYAEENNSKPLLETCIAFIVMDTTFMMLLYISRFLCADKKQPNEPRANWSMISLMTGTYLVCISKITLGFRTSPCTLSSLID
jgi:hypothetical protein